MDSRRVPLVFCILSCLEMLGDVCVVCVSLLVDVSGSSFHVRFAIDWVGVRVILLVGVCSLHCKPD